MATARKRPFTGLLSKPIRLDDAKPGWLKPQFALPRDKDDVNAFAREERKKRLTAFDRRFRIDPNSTDIWQSRVPPDTATPIPRPSRYYGRRQDLVTRDRAQGLPKMEGHPLADTSIIPPSPDSLPARIDKSVLTIAEPKRLRDKAHLAFVRSQPCLVCGHQPCDPHHLQFAQPRALGLKVSDEFTVPLCRNHHQQLHQAGNELAWWHHLGIKALEIANRLWAESHPNPTSLADQSTDHNRFVREDSAGEPPVKV